MPDYSRGKIYAIRAPGTDEVYIGSTTKQYLSCRLGQHRQEFKKWKEGKNKYITSFKLLEREGAYIELIELFPCDTKEQLNRREGEIMRATTNCVNKAIAGRTQQEWYSDNFEKISQQKKDYNQAHIQEKQLNAKNHYESNKQQYIQKAAEWRDKNRQRMNELARMRYAKKKAQASQAECPPSSTHPSPAE